MTEEGRACAQCGTPLTWRPRFCSQQCYGEWVEAQPPLPSSVGIQAEMRASLEALRAQVEDH